MDYSKLNGKIREIYKTQYAFANAMQLSRQTINAKLNNKTQWTTSEIMKACEVLGIPADEAHIYFFAFKVDKYQLNKKG